MKSIIEKELVTFSGKKFSETSKFYEYIRDMLDRVYVEGRIDMLNEWYRRMILDEE